MITVPPRHYCIIENPVLRDKEHKVVFDESGQAKLLHADQEIRLAQDPFPLYPGEVLKQVRLKVKLFNSIHLTKYNLNIKNFSVISQEVNIYKNMGKEVEDLYTDLFIFIHLFMFLVNEKVSILCFHLAYLFADRMCK